jgi:hypothetical protein
MVKGLILGMGILWRGGRSGHNANDASGRLGADNRQWLLSTGRRRNTENAAYGKSIARLESGAAGLYGRFERYKVAKLLYLETAERALHHLTIQREVNCALDEEDP